MRKPLIAGNWKMHTTRAQARVLAAAIVSGCVGLSDRDVLLAPPFTALSQVSREVSGSPIIVAGQNVCWQEQGAFTGEISPAMLSDCGATAVIIGHSERRQLFGEDDKLINRRIHGALAAGLLVVFCIGETLAHREAEKTLDILKSQLHSGLAGLAGDSLASVIIAYEPVWAIGTGKTASSGQAQEVHTFIRAEIGRMYKKEIAENLRILYGGSVKPDNIDDLMAQPDIDGALVGGAALDAESFNRIIHFTKQI